MKKMLIFILLALLVAGGVVWHYRYDIFQLSAENIVRKMLPEYVHVDQMVFDIKNGLIEIKGFGIRNPEGFRGRYLATIDELSCRFRMRGDNILDGIEVTAITAAGPQINIERLRDGRINVNEMGQVMQAEAPKEVTAVEREPEKKKGMKKIAGKKISDVIELTDTVDITDGRINFTDNAVMRQPYILTFEGVNGSILLHLNEDYTDVNSVSSRGSGLVNGDRGQTIGWNISWYPKSPLLTMSNRFEVSNVDIVPFRPYYDRYSPIDIMSGTASGTLVFDFDNGNIGSDNVVTLRRLRFREKEGGTAANFWNVTISDLIQYLRSSPDEITFDFKIKGNMRSPQFYPGPRVNRAMQRMAVDQIQQMLAPEEEGGAQTGGAEKSDAEKVVDVLRGLMNQ